MSIDSARDLNCVATAPSSPDAGDPAAQWRQSAACRREDPELFFPIGSVGAGAAEIQRAKAVCAGCPVRRPCLAFALATGQNYGIWGGYDEDERRSLHRQWRESKAAPAAPAAPATAFAVTPRPGALLQPHRDPWYSRSTPITER